MMEGYDKRKIDTDCRSRFPIQIRIDSRIDLDTQTLRYQNYNNKERDKDGKGQRVRDNIHRYLIFDAFSHLSLFFSDPTTQSSNVPKIKSKHKSIKLQASIR